MHWPLVGRSTTVDHATDLIAEGVGLAILGTAGVGKSRVLHEVASRTAESSTVLPIMASSESISIQLARGTQTIDPLDPPPFTMEGDRIIGSVDIAAIDPDQPDGATIAFDLSIPLEAFDCSQL